MNKSQINIWFISCNHLLPCEQRLSFPLALFSSEDDTFLLYATLQSGKDCKFVTRDFLRDHKACLSDSLMRHVFRKWQRGHQIVISSSGEGKRLKFLVSFLLHSESSQSIFIKDTQFRTQKDSCESLRNGFVPMGSKLSCLLNIRCIHKACHKHENSQKDKKCCLNV